MQTETIGKSLHIQSESFLTILGVLNGGAQTHQIKEEDYTLLQTEK